MKYKFTIYEYGKNEEIVKSIEVETEDTEFAREMMGLPKLPLFTYPNFPVYPAPYNPQDWTITCDSSDDSVKSSTTTNVKEGDPFVTYTSGYAQGGLIPKKDMLTEVQDKLQKAKKNGVLYDGTMQANKVFGKSSVAEIYNEMFKPQWMKEMEKDMGEQNEE